MTSFLDKHKQNASILPDERHDGLSVEKNLVLYDRLTEKLRNWPYSKLPGNQGKFLAEENARNKFAAANIVDEINCLMGIIQLMSGKANTCNLSIIGRSQSAGSLLLSSSLSNWTKQYCDVRIVDTSASGLFATQSNNLLELL